MAEVLSLTPGTHIVEGDNGLLQVVLWPPHVHDGIYTRTTLASPRHTHKLTVNKTMFKKNSFDTYLLPYNFDQLL